MNTNGMSVWQVSGGPSSRSYAEVFLEHGVALIGPGDAGPWAPERDDDEFEGGFVRGFASEVAAGDVFLLRTGIGARRASRRDRHRRHPLPDVRRERRFEALAYANLARLRQPAADLFVRMRRP